VRQEFGFIYLTFIQLSIQQRNSVIIWCTVLYTPYLSTVGLSPRCRQFCFAVSWRIYCYQAGYQVAPSRSPIRTSGTKCCRRHVYRLLASRIEA